MVDITQMIVNEELGVIFNFTKMIMNIEKGKVLLKSWASYWLVSCLLMAYESLIR